jgi:tetratricopeptide (TPR) repeat protein
MQGHRTRSSWSFWRLKYFGMGCAVVAMAGIAQQANAQFANKMGRSIVSGSVVIDGDAQPAAGVRVDVKAVSGGAIATAFTDGSGRFEASAEGGGGSVIVEVQERGYEAVEQRVDLGLDGSAPGVIITLHRSRATPVEPVGYKVSVHDLKVPGKARREFEKGLDRLHKNDVEGSLEHFKEATNAFPDYYEAYYQIGMANLELRRRDDAEQALQRAIDLSGGGYAEPQFALGALLCDQKQYPEAERVLRRAIEVDGNSWKGHLFLGEALFGENRLAEAEKSAQEVLLRRSDVPTVYLLLANIHIRKREYALGVKDLDAFLSMKPDGPTADQARAVRSVAERTALGLKQALLPASPKAY